jgi:hypothetical protein
MMSLLPDSCLYTPGGRRLLISLGYVTEDPLRVEAEQWLRDHDGPRTPATEAVRAAIGPDWPAEWLEEADRFKNTPWKTPRG